MFFKIIKNIVQWAIPEKKKQEGTGGGGVDDMEFPGVLKKEHMKILGVN